jgi:multicomponent Na+:H+ antiporter subunit D
MIHQLPGLIVIVPLLASLAAAASGWVNRKYPFIIAFLALSFTAYASVSMLIYTAGGNVLTYHMSGWAPPVGISYKIDGLNALVLTAIQIIALINLPVSNSYVKYGFEKKEAPFYGLYLLFITGLTGITATEDAFNLYVLLEVSSLTGYALIGMGNTRSPFAALNYLIIGTIGASLYLLGVGYIYIKTGTLNMTEMSLMLPLLKDSSTIIMAFCLCVAGILTKAALFPMHGWLPGAYSNGPNASMGIIAPLTTKVMIYVLIRLGISIFGVELFIESFSLSNFMVNFCAIAIIAAALKALYHTKLKKILSYIIIMEVGYMAGGFFLGNSDGTTGAIIHIINDAAMTFCLFIAAGAITSKFLEEDIRNIRGIFEKMPFTSLAFAGGALAVIGIPPTCGFFSKWYLIKGGFGAGQYLFAGALIFSSFINAVIFFRIFEKSFFSDKGHHKTPENHQAQNINIKDSQISEAPLSIVIPLVSSLGLIIFLGLMTGKIVENYIIHLI